LKVLIAQNLMSLSHLDDPRFQHLFQPSLGTLEHMMLLCQPSFPMLLEGSPSSLQKLLMLPFHQGLHIGYAHWFDP